MVFTNAYDGSSEVNLRNVCNHLQKSVEYLRRRPRAACGFLANSAAECSHTFIDFIVVFRHVSAEIPHLTSCISVLGVLK